MVLIVVDGIYSAGKSTLIRRLVDDLAGIVGPGIAVSEWNSSDILGESIPLWKRDGLLGPHSLLFVEAADLAHRNETAIRPHLDSGRVVIADRYVLTGMARSVIRGVEPALAEVVFRFAPRELMTVLVECSAEVTLQRRKRLGKHLGGYHSGRDFRRTDSVEADFVRYQAQMQALYRSLAAARGGSITIDGERSLDECSSEVLAAVSDRLAGVSAWRPGAG
jgi:dTMP kinase